MRPNIFDAVLILLGVLGATSFAVAESPGTATGGDPADRLPPHIKRVTWFGERADWSHDGKRILFLSKTLGDAMEIALETNVIRNLTAHYPHRGYTRALYLANGDILLRVRSHTIPSITARLACSVSCTSSTGA